jgi:hypothetical protein
VTQFHKAIMPGKHGSGNKEVLAGKRRAAHYFNE